VNRSLDVPLHELQPIHKAWQQMPEKLAQLSTRGAQITVKNSGHYIQLDHPDVVVDALRKLVNQVRSESMLRSC
jgi:hypothetical protein